MKGLIIILLSIFCCTSAISQQKAVTENGDEVILYDDHSWQYVDIEAITDAEIQTNSRKFKKDESASFQLKSKVINMGFYLDPKKWSFTKGENNEDAEYELQLKGEDLYGMIITEKVEISLPSLKKIAFESAQSVAPDVKIIKEEYRNVNNIKVLLLQMNGTTQGIKFSYYGYYYSSESGTVQFVTYTAQNLLEGYLDECELLLNGITEM